MRWLSVLALSAAFSVSVVAAAAFAQTTAAITGTVTGLGGDAVANAPIRATEVATKKLYTTTSSEKGSYTIAQLPAGAYDLSVDVPGFNSYSQKNLAVAAGQRELLAVHPVKSS